MKSKFRVFIPFMIMIFFVSIHSSIAQQQSGNDSTDVLKKKISELEIKTKLQQEKINQLEGMIGELKKKKPFAVFPSDPLKDRRPNNAFPFEFNGNTYYFVPLIGKSITDIETLERTNNNSK